MVGDRVEIYIMLLSRGGRQNKVSIGCHNGKIMQGAPAHRQNDKEQTLTICRPPAARSGCRAGAPREELRADP